MVLIQTFIISNTNKDNIRIISLIILDLSKAFILVINCTNLSFGFF